MGVKTDPHTPGPLRESSKFLALRAVFFALCHSSARAAGPPAGIAPVDSLSGGFAIGGDLAAHTRDGNTGDWLLLLEAAGAKFVLQRQQFHGCGTSPAFPDPRSTGAAYRGLIASVCVCN
jgi:hypothetical protein